MGEEIYWHWQNLDTDADNKPKGSGLRHGRAWLHVAHMTFGVSWKVPSNVCDFTIGVDPDRERAVHGCIALPPVTLWWHVESWPLSRRIEQLAKDLGWRKNSREWSFARELSVRVHDWALWWMVWRDPWSGGSPRSWRDGSWHPFGHPGSRIGEEEQREKRLVEVPMPEGVYFADATRTVGRIRHPRLPFLRQRITTVELDFGDKPVPIPGKGENSWDCGEDATYASSSPARTIEHAVGKFVASTLERRRRYGGENWRPAPKPQAASAE